MKMKILIAVLLAAVTGGCAVWGYGEAMSNKSEDSLHATLRQLAEDFVDAANRGDREAMDQLTKGRAHYEVGFAFEQKLPDFIGPPLGASLISAAGIWGPAEVDQFRLEAVGERAALGDVATSFPGPSGESRRRVITNTGGYLIFVRDQNQWLITGTVVG